MAQMPIQQLAGRADFYAAPSHAASAPKAGGAPLRTSYVLDPGGISGGLLRPGAIDQEQFKAALAAAQKQSTVGPPPLKMTAPPGTPTLSPAQFAALGAVEDSGAAASPTAEPAVLAAPVPSDVAPKDAASSDPDAATPPTNETMPTTPAAVQASAAEARAERGPIPGSHRGADGVWELPRLPDKDEREMLRGQKWRLVENPQSRQLFLGPDGEFGWDDFVDLINPLQHIPFVNVAYRAITGDQIYGAARLVDFAFGPAAGASTALDLAMQSTTGHGLADTAIAALFGPSDDDAGAVASINTASGRAQQIADAGFLRRGSND